MIEAGPFISASSRGVRGISTPGGGNEVTVKQRARRQRRKPQKFWCATRPNTRYGSYMAGVTAGGIR